MLIGPLGTNFSEILIEIFTFSFKKMHFKMSSGKWRPFCLSLNVLTTDNSHQKQKIVNLIILLSLVAPKVIEMTTSSVMAKLST